MPDLGNTGVFSQTDSSNASGTMPSWSGAAAPSTLDDAGRAFQGAVTREWNWRNYTVTSGGTGTALTLTYSVAPAAYYNGQRFAFITNTAVTGSCTLNVNSLGATTIKKVLGGTLTNLAASDIPAGTFVEVAYNTANTCFVLLNSILPLIADSSGNVGIGTTPTAKLDIVGPAGGTSLRLTDNTNSTLTIKHESPGNLLSYETTGTANQRWVLNSTERLRLDNTGSLLLVSSGGLGYGTGSGGSVTQLTSKSTSVTLNKPNGAITMNGATLAGGASIGFSVFDSSVAITDTVILNVKYGTEATPGSYRLWSSVAAGSFVVFIKNETAGSLSEAVVVNFSIIKAVTA